MKTIPFFFRFYGRTDDEIKQCMEEIKALGDINPIRFRISNSKLSCNVFVPLKYQPVRELNYYFNTMEEAKRMRQDDVKAIYTRWSIKIKPVGTVIIKREYKDLAFGLQEMHNDC